MHLYASTCAVRSHCVIANAVRSAYPWSRQACRVYSTSIDEVSADNEHDIHSTSTIDVTKYDHLDPAPLDYSSTPFTDACKITLASGAGGHGCISFLREKYIANGPPNGGDGGTGGNVYIQAVRGETSLHKIARRRMVKAGRGKSGQGGSRGGKRGEDVILTVPVGTVIREISRIDPVAEEIEDGRRSKSIGYGRDAQDDVEDENAVDETRKWRRDRWLLYPGAMPKNFTTADFPPLPRPRKSNLALSAPPAPIRFDLDKPMVTPLLLAAGALGGLGNPHFETKSIPRPKYATKGDEGVTLELQLELKLLADVGLVGLPNAGKSTLLRSLTASRARVGNWAFTTLAPNIGTVVLDKMSGPASQTRRLLDSDGALRANFTIADIPGLIEGAHLDKGLGLDFLRHIERAAALAFVVDLTNGDAVTALKGLWMELKQYELLRHGDRSLEAAKQTAYQPFTSSTLQLLEKKDSADEINTLPPLSLPPLASKPWLVVGTKADLPESQANYTKLKAYLAQVEARTEKHPADNNDAWREKCRVVPVCALKQHNTEQVLDHLVELLQGR